MAVSAAELNTVLRSPVRTSFTLLNSPLWQRQADIMQSVVKHARTSVKACTASGKTYLASRFIVWWLMRYKDAVVITTATTWKQVERQLWAEIRKTVYGCRDRIQLPDPLQTQLEFGPGRYALGISPGDEESIGGYHEGHVLIVIDEGSGVRQLVYDGAEGPMSGGHARLLELGNPLHPSGPFHDHHTKHRAIYNCFTISAFDTPNFNPLRLRAEKAGLKGGDATSFMLNELRNTSADECHSWITHPKLITPTWVRERLAVWGIDHPKFEARVLGQFPRYSEHALIPLAWIEEAELRPAFDDGVSPIEVGIDVAGPGEDETCVAVRCGKNLLKLRPFNDSDPTAGVVAMLMPFRDRIRVIRYDSIGIGYHFGERLREVFESERCTVLGVNVSEASADPERFKNLRAELHWSLRERFEENDIDGLDDDELSSQAALMEYFHDSRGRIQIAPKDKLPTSPDRFESVMMAFGSSKNAVEVYDGPLFTQQLTGRSRYRKEF